MAQPSNHRLPAGWVQVLTGDWCVKATENVFVATPIKVEFAFDQSGHLSPQCSGCTECAVINESAMDGCTRKNPLQTKSGNIDACLWFIPIFVPHYVSLPGLEVM